MSFSHLHWLSAGADEGGHKNVTIGPAPMCLSCKHFVETEKGNVCKVFPEGIPREIFFEYYDHRREFPGDGGIRFELKYEEERKLIEFIYGKGV